MLSEKDLAKLDGATTRHKNEHTGLEPANPGVYSQDKAEGTAGGARDMHRLYELAREHYLFDLAPLYVIARADFDILAQYLQDVKLDVKPGLLDIRTAAPVLCNEGMGKWGNVIYAVPKQFRESVRRYMLQLLFIDLKNKPFKYWRVDVVEALMLTPGDLSLKEAPVDVYLPTGIDNAVGLYRDGAANHHLTKLAPEAWVVEEARRYFTSALPEYFNSMSRSRGK